MKINDSNKGVQGALHKVSGPLTPDVALRMKPIVKHIIYWFAGAVLAFTVIFISVSITDIAPLDGTAIQRSAASLNLVMGWPGNLLCLVLPNADGPVYFFIEAAVWGIISGEIALIVKRIAT